MHALHHAMGKALLLTATLPVLSQTALDVSEPAHAKSADCAPNGIATAVCRA